MQTRQKTPIKDILTVFAVQVIYCKVIFFILYLLFGLTLCNGEKTLDMFLLAVIIAPIVEEFLYRYVPLKIAKNYFRKNIITIAIASSVIFGLHHGSVLNIPIQGVFGLLFTWVYIRNGLPYAILSHALWNLYCFIS